MQTIKQCIKRKKKRKKAKQDKNVRAKIYKQSYMHTFRATTTKRYK